MKNRLTPHQLARVAGVHVATVWRWLTTGVRGKKLASVMIGGRRYIYTRDWQAFVQSGASGQSYTATRGETPFLRAESRYDASRPGIARPT